MSAQAKSRTAIFARSGALFAIAVMFAAAVYWSARLAWADLLFRRNDLASVTRAVRLSPMNERYVAWQAELTDTAGRDPEPLLERASLLNPLDSRVWIRRGLSAELRGDRSTAERLLLRAANVDRLFEPRWTLMNFYFRQGDARNFWAWVPRAFAVTYGDRTPIFDLCWHVSPDAAAIQRAIPEDTETLTQFASFLTTKLHAYEASNVAVRVLAQPGAPESSRFIDLVDRMISEDATDAAVRLWNELCRRHVLPYQSLAPDRGESVTNGTFQTFPSGHGFDWHAQNSSAIRALKTQSPDALRISLSGDEPENCTLLSQIIPVRPDGDYDLKFQYRTANIGSGIRLTASGAATPDLGADEWNTGELHFHVTSATLANIALEYHRPAGSVRAQGSIALRDFRLTFAPTQPPSSGASGHSRFRAATIRERSAK